MGDKSTSLIRDDKLYKAWERNGFQAVLRKSNGDVYLITADPEALPLLNAVISDSGIEINVGGPKELKKAILAFASED